MATVLGLAGSGQRPVARHHVWKRDISLPCCLRVDSARFTLCKEASFSASALEVPAELSWVVIIAVRERACPNPVMNEVDVAS